jgi:hypothetical protein
MTSPEKKSLFAGQLADGLLEAAVFGGAGLFLLTALFVGGRHWAGALDKPLPAAALAGLGAGLGAAAAALRGLARRLPAQRWMPAGRMLFSAGVSLAVLCFGFALSTSDSSAAGRTILWLLLLAEETWAWTHFRPKTGPKTGTQLVYRPSPQGAPSKPAPSPLPAFSGEIAETDDVPGGDVLQHWTRRKSAGGEEELAGWVRMPVAAGQRNGNVHVAFCPPFSRVPELAVAQVDGPEARIKTAQLFPYGVRLDLKLAAAAPQPGSVLVYLNAKVPTLNS